MTPLHSAVYYGHLQIVIYLVEHKAKINERNKSSMTPLLLARVHQQNDIFGFLRLNGGIV